MARYAEINGKLVPVDKDGKRKRGTAFYTVNPETHRDPFLEAPKGPVSCPRCHKVFENISLAVEHDCQVPEEDTQAEVGSVEQGRPVEGAGSHADEPVPSPAVKQIARELAEVVLRPCAYCGKALRGRANQKYCDTKCRVAAARKRKRKQKAKKG